METKNIARGQNYSNTWIYADKITHQESLFLSEMEIIDKAFIQSHFYESSKNG